MQTPVPRPASCGTGATLSRDRACYTSRAQLPSRRCVVTPPADRTPITEDSRQHLVGRHRELRDLRRLLDTAMEGRGQLVLLGGEAGVGKTTIAEALCREAAERGALVLVGHCYDLSDTPPYGPWMDTFAGYQPEGELPSPPGAFARTEAADAIMTRSALFDGMRHFVATLSERRPLVLLLEDLHWADPESLDLLRVVAREAVSQALLVLATFRGDELASSHPLYRLLPVLEREAAARRLELRRLHPEALLDLVVARYRLTEANSARLVAYLYAQADGNPFFTQQLLRALEEDEVLRPLGNRWVLGDLAGANVPLALRQVIDARLLRLDGEGQRLLRTAAVIGQDVSFSLWASVAGREEEGLLALVEEATAARLIEPETGGAGFRFVHALVREALYEGVNPLRRRVLHREVGEALAALPSPDPDAVAYHFRQAGDARAAGWLVEAGGRAERASALLTASERYEAALTMLDGRGGQAGERGWLRLRLAVLQRFRKPREALVHVEEAERVAREANDPGLTARVPLVRGLLRVYAEGISEGLEDVAAGVAAVEALPSGEEAREPRERSIDVTVNGGMLAAMLSWAGRLTEARVRGEERLATTTNRRDAAAVVGAWWGLALVHAMQGRVEEARRAYAATRAAYETLDQHRLLAFVLRDELTYVMLPYLGDHLAERERLAAAAEQAVLRGNAAGAIDEPAEYSRYPRLPLMVSEGEWRETRRIISVLDEYGVHAILRNILSSFLGPLARDQGEIRLAWQQVHKAWPGGPSTEPGDGDVYYTLPLQRLAVELSLDSGHLDDAREWLEAHERWLTWSGALLGLSEAQTLRARYYRAANDSEQARRHADRALARASEPRQPLAMLAAHRLLGELGSAGGRYDDAASHLDDALQLADACAAPYERALTLLAIAELRLAEGNGANVPTLLEEARGICSDLGAAPALARADALVAQLPIRRRVTSTYPAGLTRREAEVLGLLAAGRSNKEIAAELFLSERTVERHITTMYRKIGTRRRTEAMAFALRHGLADVEEASGE
jgi:DNA-binding CsgD family transcriptional regulator